MSFLSNLFHRRDARPAIVVVSGLPRSGTSMLMRMLEAGGIPPLTDGQRTADDDNPRGYYEFEAVKQMREGDLAWVPQARGRAVKVISALLSYLPGDQRYKVLFVQRALPEVLASQRKMLVNRGENPDAQSDREMAQYFEKHLRQVTLWLNRQPNMDVLYVDYNALLKNPAPHIQEICEFLGQALDEAAMGAVIDPNLYRHRKPAEPPAA
ncbi:MAG: sulfotransferase domain-containing protein [Chloroflexota bacterium]